MSILKEKKRVFFCAAAAALSAIIMLIVCSETNPAYKEGFVRNYYSLTTDVSPAEGGSVSCHPNAETYAEGARVQVTAAARAGWAFERWIGSVTGTNSSITLNMDAHKAVIAVFKEQQMHTLTIHINPPDGGTVSRGPEADSYAAGETVTVTAEAKEGYVFAGWTGEGVNDADSPTAAVSMHGDITLIANFERNDDTAPTEYTLTLNPNFSDRGTVSRDPDAEIYQPGDIVAITATAEAGYTFRNWTGDGIADPSLPATTVTMNGNKMVIANFEPERYTLTVNAIPQAGGTVSPANQEYVDVGSPVNISAAANNGYRFAHWTVTSGTATFADANSNITTVTLSTDATIIATFRLQYYYTLTLNASPIAGGTVTQEYSHHDDNTVTYSVEAVPANGYMFVNWKLTGGGTVAIANPNSARTSVTMMQGNATVTANFSQIPTYTLTVSRSPTAGGTVSPASQSGIAAGTVVSISASPASGYTFNGWTVTSGTATIANPNSASTFVTVNGNATVTVNFTFNLFNPNINYGSFIDPRDSKSYRTVTIGSQTWMAENLNYDVPGVTTDVCYNNQESNCNTYGRLYDWATVMNGASSSTSRPSGVQGICPSGWYVPSEVEWTTLTDFAGGLSAAGRKLKSATGWIGGGNGTDEYGFSALPGGSRWGGGHFYDAGSYGFWWSATEGGADIAWGRGMYSSYDNVYRDSNFKTYLFSVRCLRD